MVNEEDMKRRFRGMGQTAMHYVLKPKYNYDTIRLLLEHGGDPTRKDRFGTTPLDLAKASGRADVIALFRKYKK